MKRILFITALFVAFTCVYAQTDTTYNYLFNKEQGQKNLWKPYASMTFQHLYVKTNTMPGIELGMTLNNHFLVGIYGQGTVGNFSHMHHDTLYNIMLGEGGVVFGYVTKPNQTLHFGGTFKLGYTSLVADDEEIKIAKDFEPVAEDDGVVYHPEVFAEINVSKYMKVKLGAGYSFYLLNNENIVCNTQLDSWTLNFGIAFSNFSK